MSASSRTFDHLQQQFLTAGFEPADAGSRAQLTLEAAAAFTQAIGDAPRWTWFVPGRIEIFGKHTDYAGGRSLLCAVPRGFAVVAGPRPDGLVRVIDARLGQTIAIDPAGEPAQQAGWSRYVAVVASRLARDFPGAAIGADIALASDLPRAAGLSSSSALVVGLATALARRADLEQRPEWQRAFAAREDLAGYLGAVENGLTFKSFTGATGVGTDGGSEDHTAILLCRAGRASAYSYLPVSHRGDAELPADWRFVVAASGIEADKAGGARDRYNHASRATQALLTRWRGRMGGDFKHLAGAVAAAPAAIPTFVSGLGADPPDGFDSTELARRLQHFMAEDARIPAALEGIQSGSRKAIADLARDSQHDAEMLLGNQIPETVALASLALSSGAFAASSFGAGFGGSVWALVDAREANAFSSRWLSAYRDQFPAIDGASVFDCRPAPALTELAPVLD